MSADGIPPGGFTVQRSTVYTIRIDEEHAELIARALVRFCMTHTEDDEAWKPADALARRLGSPPPRNPPPATPTVTRFNSTASI